MIKSPVTLKDEVRKVDELFVEKICSAYKSEIGIDVKDYFSDPIVSIFQCSVTGYRFYHPESLMASAEFYEWLQEHMENAYYPKKWEHYKALKFIKPSFKILEIGCGNGSFLKICQSQGFENIFGLEINKSCVETLNNEGITVYNKKIEEFANSEEKSTFDIVCAFQVMEHIYQVNSFITSSLSCLKKGGKLILCVPNNNPYLFRHDKYHTLNLPPHHIGLWNKESLVNLGKFFNLKTLYYNTEPIKDYKKWFLAQKEYFIKKHRAFKFLNAIPRPIYKGITYIASPVIEGQYSFIVYEKP